VRHSTSEDQRIHTENLERALPPPRVERVDQVLQITTPSAVQAYQRLSSNVSHCLSTGQSEGGT
jgi:hypothetical protein